jgi:hypothetical protein
MGFAATGVDSMKKIVMAAFGLLAIPAIVSAEPKDENISKGDQNRVVCRKENVTGSRLGARKRCLTAAEWTEMARLDRQSVERIQNMRYKGNEGGGAGIDPFGRLN